MTPSGAAPGAPPVATTAADTLPPPPPAAPPILMGALRRRGQQRPARRGRLNRPCARRLAEYHRALQLVELGTHLRARLLRLPHLVFLEA